MIHYIDSNQINTELLNSNKIVLIEFYLVDSELCQKQHEILREIERNNTDTIDIFKVDITETQDLKMSYDVSSAPTIIFYRNNIELEKLVGFTEKEKIIEIIEDLNKA